MRHAYDCSADTPTVPCRSADDHWSSSGWQYQLAASQAGLCKARIFHARVPERDPGACLGRFSSLVEIIDAIVRGLKHSPNNRALALSATIESLDIRRAVGAEIFAASIGESAQLRKQLRQLRAFPFAAASEPMPMLLPDVLSAALQLHQSHAVLGDVSAYLEGSAEKPAVGGIRVVAGARCAGHADGDEGDPRCPVAWCGCRMSVPQST